MGTNPSEYPRQWKVFHDNFEGFFVLAFLYHLDVTLHVESGRAGQTARRGIRFLDSPGAWNCLSIFFERRFSG